MPTLAEFDGIRICMYAADHAPPHFHVLFSGNEATVRISDLVVTEGALPRTALRKALAWATVHQAALALRWIQLNEE